jgi:hypothetical protein
VSDPQQPGAAPTRVRPSTVTVSSYLLFAAAALIAVEGIVSLSTAGATAQVYREAYAGTQAAGSEGFVVAATIVGAVLNLLVAAGLVVLALLNNRGKNPARVVTWVVGGLTVCCSSIGLIGTAAFSNLSLPTEPGMPSQAELQRRLEDALPGWAGPVTMVVGILALVALLGALLLLALPASNAFFRKPAPQTWDPLAGGYAYPAGQAYPGYPPASGPGYPGAAPTYPPAPGAPADAAAAGAPDAPRAPDAPGATAAPGPGAGAPGDAGPGSDGPERPPAGPAKGPGTD